MIVSLTFLCNFKSEKGLNLVTAKFILTCVLNNSHFKVLLSKPVFLTASMDLPVCKNLDDAGTCAIN